ncbi:MAG: 4Fe-4S dicluster domain-containing protein [Candidatus Shapirobacteria bacterium]|jgi:hypothetical protein
MKYRPSYFKYSPIPYTGCKYCLPCPFGVNIPRNFEIYNEMKMFDCHETSAKEYGSLDDLQKASNCRQCGKCEPLCPQKIAIRDWLVKVAGI